jgi:1,4-alpha-glucan branching enzyme
MTNTIAIYNKAKHLADISIRKDSYLKSYEEIITRRIQKILQTEKRLTNDKQSLIDFAAGHEFFGLHFKGNERVFREWAPNAEAIYIIGEMTQWKEIPEYRLQQVGTQGIWEIRMPGDAVKHQALYRLRIHWPGGNGDRIPAYARRVVQDPVSGIFNAQVWQPPRPYVWKNEKPEDLNGLLVYEAHIGMAQEDECVGSFKQFEDNILPRIIHAGYNTIQLMAVQEHPYYGSFGYHVSNFFALSSRFGTPDEFKSLVDAAHQAGLRVIMDLVHSHAVKNETEGLSRFDGTLFQYFHEGSRGNHLAWDSRCFDYAKPEVLHFLLSNCRFWLDEYHVDGFRFDGITSMLYLDHGLEKAFMSYDHYFDSNVDEDALVYLALANKVIHSVNPDSITIAEDISGIPGLAATQVNGGIGFDFRFAMGIPDFWIKLIKEHRDEQWPLETLWFELNNRRQDEKTISYCESHDQALVGDQTLIFRLIGSAIYDHMHKHDTHPAVDRGMAMHKIIRLITLATAGSGYLNFMGNEFGHPEWIDFPRQGNNWSYQYARRQWHLSDDENLKYTFLAQFDRDMIVLAKRHRILQSDDLHLCFIHEDDKIIAFIRAGLLFVFGFHPDKSYEHYLVDAPPGKYQLIFNSDDRIYGGHHRLAEGQVYFTRPDGTAPHFRNLLSLYIPTRTAIVLEKI